MVAQLMKQYLWLTLPLRTLLVLVFYCYTIVAMELGDTATSTPEQILQLNQNLKNLDESLGKIVGVDYSYSQPSLSCFADLYGNRREEKIEVRNKIRLVLRKGQDGMPLLAQDFEALEHLYKAVNKPSLIYSIYIFQKNLTLNEIESCNNDLDKILACKQFFVQNRIESQHLVIPIGALSRPSEESCFGYFFPKLALGDSLAPRKINANIFSLLSSNWQNSQQQYNTGIIGEEDYIYAPIFRSVFFNYHLFLVTSVTTNKQEPLMKISAGNLSVSEAAEAIKKAMQKYHNSYAHIFMPLTFGEGGVGHLTLLYLQNYPGNGLSCKYIDSCRGYANRGNQLNEVYESLRMIFPDITIDSPYYAGHQGLLNWTDCSRFVATYIYLTLSELRPAHSFSFNEVSTSLKALFENSSGHESSN